MEGGGRSDRDPLGCYSLAQKGNPICCRWPVHSFVGPINSYYFNA